MDSSPFFSIVIPTRDRPELVRFAIDSVLAQDFSDFEVIVSDNFTHSSCENIVTGLQDQRFHYVRPPSKFSMSENWDFACERTKGVYVMVLIDKTFLRPDALSTIKSALVEWPTEMVSFWNEMFDVKDPKSNLNIGIIQRSSYPPSYPQYFSCESEVNRRLGLRERRGAEGVNYYYGKICFGVYHRDLIARIKKKQKNLFFPVSPDYTSMFAALLNCDKGLDIGQPLLISYGNIGVSNGANAASSAEASLGFYKTIPNYREIFKKMPFPNLFCCAHNSVAHDYLESLSRNDQRNGKSLDRVWLYIRCREDFALLRFTNLILFLEQYYYLLKAYYSIDDPGRQSIKKYFRNKREELRSLNLEKSRIEIRNFVNSFKVFLKRVLGKTSPLSNMEKGQFGAKEEFSTIREAAETSAKYYTDKLAEKV